MWYRISCLGIIIAGWAASTTFAVEPPAKATRHHPNSFSASFDHSNVCRDLFLAAAADDFDLQSAAVQQSIRDLRDTGQDAVTWMIRTRPQTPVIATDATRDHYDELIDQVAAQFNAAQSGLFWHTSLDSALSESQRTGRPILSLRLLGKLNQEQTCANSRFFRSSLYPNPWVSDLMKQGFVLHWQSVRDVPMVTIDLGQGRKLVQPITGNSAHLVLDSTGRPLDVMPGLVSADRFTQWLRSAIDLADQVDGSTDHQAVAKIAAFHRRRAAQRRSECPLAIRPGQPVRDINPLDPRWIQFAKTEAEQSTSTAAVQPLAEAAMITTVGKAVAEAPLLRAIPAENPLTARDTVLNLFVLQTCIDDHFSTAKDILDVPQLTSWIYADVFLMPLDDPWLGLSLPPRIVALRNGGRIEPDTVQ
ncbi:hypothetical protein K227x_13770 [Rubripirellula lacrimiformis]|uniref:Uncharacterized protein n=1 Tax=Rubripirellula lacrimiformis TaxID=1930273 RepID=A0A517N7M4_9BACT|nr:hypothetical protein [Rubripirellula lacrimiformis]QDT02998.1 hypothetical protein K227x_13770 [Rubripirellula lacrimiformis]